MKSPPSEFRRKAEKLVEEKRRSGVSPAPGMDLEKALLELEIARAELDLQLEDRVRHEKLLADAAESALKESEDRYATLIENLNISQRNSSEALLRESEEKYRALVEASPDAICFNDMGGNFLMVNQQFCRLFGFRDLVEIRTIGVNSRTLVFEEDFAPMEKSVEILMNLGFVRNVFMRVYRKDRTVFPASFSVSLNRNKAGEPIGILSVIRDMTEVQQADCERRRLEAQIRDAQKLESLGILAGGIAHDFNNMLMVILGNADLALRDLSQVSPARPRLMEIDKVSRRAADLCTQMLAYSGKGKFVIGRVDLSEVVEEMGNMLEVAISKKAILSYHLSRDLPKIEGDAAQLRQIVMNLMINASEAVGEKGGVISISTGVMTCDKKKLDQAIWKENLIEGEYVFLEVADSGCGMDPTTVSKIFDPFFTTKFTGRGLGLAAVQGIVRGHRGIINVQSNPGQGTAFRVAFPNSSGEGEPVEGPVVTDRNWKGSGKILVVDDEEAVRETCRNLLEFMGFEVQVAADGVQGVEMFRKTHSFVRCVILDLTMPHMDGEEAFGEMVKIDPGVRVVVSSGYTEQEMKSRFGGSGRVGFIQKPYRLDDLARIIKVSLGE